MFNVCCILNQIPQTLLHTICLTLLHNFGDKKNHNSIKRSGVIEFSPPQVVEKEIVEMENKNLC